MPYSNSPGLLVAPCDFGWGSLGKMRLILEKLPPMQIRLFASEAFAEVVRRQLGPDHALHAYEPGACNLALVINDPAAANLIAAQNVTVIYVDSLPYLWATSEEVPHRQSVACYCAQRFPPERLPLSSPLRHWPGIDWIDPIVPAARGRRGGRGVVVNVGGLHSHMADAAADSYLELVLFPAVKALADQGQVVLAVCGNLDASACAFLAALLPNCTHIGPRTPRDFERLLREADLLVTSPGSTTILQAAALRLPTLLLPPQNLSQIFNTELYADPAAPIIRWPASVLDLARVDQVRPQGEEAALRFIYGAIDAAARSPKAIADVAAVIRAGLQQAPAFGVLSQSLGAVGADGAGQVARRVKQFLLAPAPRAGRPTD